MSKNSIIAAVIAILVMPVIYLVLNGLNQQPKFSFRGLPVMEIEPQNGELFVPNEVENQNAVPMRATLKASFVEKTSGLKLPFAEDLVLSVNSTVNRLDACLEDGTTPEQARFDLAARCSAAQFEKMVLERKTIVEVEPAEKFIVFGATSNNQIKLYYKNMIASYVSKDMTQGDRKREACIVRIMLDHLLGQPANVEVSCQAAS
jgi:hypothetical protein